jgi:hypothetical protein
MPLPAMELILEIGRHVRTAPLSLEEIDALIAEMLQLKKSDLNQELYAAIEEEMAPGWFDINRHGRDWNRLLPIAW